MWEGVIFREMVNQSRNLVKNQCGSDLSERDLLDLCLEIEQGHLATPQPKFYLKKFRRFRALGGQVCRQRDIVIRACREVDQCLFPDEMGAVDDEEWLNLPKGLMIMGLEELIQITVAKSSSKAGGEENTSSRLKIVKICSTTEKEIPAKLWANTRSSSRYCTVSER
jgi:hypothetical protein